MEKEIDIHKIRSAPPEYMNAEEAAIYLNFSLSYFHQDIKPSKRDQIFNKFGGKCAYTGKDLPEDWQVDHGIPKSRPIWWQSTVTKRQLGLEIDNPNDIKNLYPSLGIVNHYKRHLTINEFRYYMSNFHIRLSALPKKPRTPKTKKRIEYMLKVAEAFGITPGKPFNGKFYFETI